MRRHPTFDASILHNPNNSFSLKVVIKNKSTIDLYIPQWAIVSTLQDYVDQEPDAIRIYFSNSTIYKKITDELLADRELSFFDKLKRMEARVPFLYFSDIRKNYQLWPNKTNISP